MFEHDLLQSLPPRPWRPVRTHDERGWAFSVSDATGANIAGREVYVDDAALMAAVHAIAPEALAYVLTAASKGGAEAVRLAERFRASLEDLRSGPTAPRARREA